MLKRTLPVIFLAASLAACADASAPTSAANVPEPAEATMQQAARGIALALGDPAVRADVRDAMRASLLVQHRLVFHDFVASAQGQRFVSAVARALEMDEAGARALFARLPDDTDFFVPAREDRRAWQATANVAVVGLALRPENGEAVAFTPRGDRVRVLLERVQPGTALFQLSPTEFRDRRVNPQADIPGAVIEDANDGTYGGRFTWTEANGESVTVDLAEISGPNARPLLNLDDCRYARECVGEGGGGIVAPSDTTFLEHFYIHYNEPNACGDPDPTFKARFYSAAGTLLVTAQIDYSEIAQYTDVYPHQPILFKRIREGSGEKINIQVIDRDSWFCGGDDDKGNRDFLASDRGQARTVFLSGSPTANVTLGWTIKY